MKIQKLRYPAMLLSIAMMFAGCSPIVADIPQDKTVYATFYPIYALADMIVEGVDGRQLHCLVQPQDDCLRSYALSDWDLYILNYGADLLLSAGNGLESFEDKLAEMGESSLPVAEILYGLEMQVFENSSDEESHFSGDNPHLYMSMNGADAILENISAAMMLLDAEKAELYEANLIKAQAELTDVRRYIEETTEVCFDFACAVMNEALFYTADDCNLSIAAQYERESGEMLYGDDLEKCIDDFRKSAVDLVLIEAQAPEALVNALEQAGFAVVRLDVMSTHAESDGAEGYLNALKNNARLIAEACIRH